MEVSTALSKAAALCSRQERCISEIEAKLIKWGLDKEGVEKIIDRLVDEKYIDEQRFANAYVRDKYQFNRWGKIKIRYQLKHKGINTNVIEDAFEGINDEKYKQNLIDLLLAKNLLIKNKDEYQRKASLIRYAASRGFEPDLIYSNIDEILSTNE